MEKKKQKSLIQFPFHLEMYQCLRLTNFIQQQMDSLKILRPQQNLMVSKCSIHEQMNELNLYSDNYSERPINLPSITQTLIHGRGKKVTKDNLIGSFENWWPTFEIKFEVKVDSFGSKPGMLLLFTANNEDCRFSCRSGQRIPAVLTSRSIKIIFLLIHFNTIKILIPKPWK